MPVTIPASLLPRGALSGRARVLLADPELGTGAVAWVVVSLRRGRHAIEAPEFGVEASTLEAAKRAIIAALGDGFNHWIVRWTFQGLDRPVAGRSLGLGLAMAVAAAMRGRTLPEGVAFTGEVDTDGRVSEVDYLDEKLEAARASGISAVVVPAGAGPPEDHNGLRIMQVATLAAAIAALLPVRRRWGRALGALLLGPLLALGGATESLDAHLWYPIVIATKGELPVHSTAVASLPLNRYEHLDWAALPALLSWLGTAKPTAIIVDADQVQDENLPEADAIAAEIRTLNEQHISVLFASKIDSRCTETTVKRIAALCVFRPAAPPIREAVGERLGHVQFETPGARFLRISPALPSEGLPALWSLAVVAERTRSGLSLTRQNLKQGTLVLDKEMPMGGGRIWLAPVEVPPSVDLADPSSAQGRVVWVGAREGKSDYRTLHGEAFYGVELNAMATEALIQGAALTRITPEQDAAAATVTALLTALVAALVGKRRWIACIVPLGALTGACLLVMNEKLAALVPLAISGAGSLWAVAEAQRR